ncbi:MAG: PEP-CTERM sorting domain-containing protein [Candidatus Schekmanbacteria bacterium]|nr:MAG: PEP-CTERM sorting domain-containing protein [Candidatus Schekmanbacteria bacterium]
MKIIKKNNLIQILFIIICFIFVSININAMVIDSFDTHQVISLSSPGTQSSSVTSTSGDILGNERDMTVQLISGAGVTVEADLGGFSVLDQSQNASSTASTTLTWDGIDNSPSLNPTGLGGIDITEGNNNNGVSLTVLFDDLPATIDISIYTDASNWSKYTINLPGGIYTTPQTYTALFSNFIIQSGSGADFSNVGAIEVFINGTTFGGTDMRFDNFVTLVPEPSSFLLLTIAISLSAIYVRRKK